MNSKWFVKSKTIIGITIGLVGALAPALGWDFTAEEAAGIAAQVAALMDEAAVVGGAILAAYGRTKSSGSLTLTP